MILGIISLFTLGTNNAQNATLFVALIWYFLLERKGYLALGLALFLIAASLFLLLNDISLAFLLALGVLALPAILLPGRYRAKEIWVLSSDGPGVFQYNFKEE